VIWVIAIIAWFAVSLPFGIALGKLLKALSDEPSGPPGEAGSCRMPQPAPEGGRDESPTQAGVDRIAAPGADGPYVEADS